MFKERMKTLLPVAIAVASVICVTAIQGVWTERWSDRDIAGELKIVASILETAFPAEVGPWRYVGEVESVRSSSSVPGLSGISRACIKIRRPGQK